MSVRFEDALDLRYMDGRKHWMVLNAFHYDTDVPLAPGLLFHRDFGQGDYRIDVPAGFETDFASVPQLFWNILPPCGSYGKAAVIHDAIYRTATLPITRAEADAIFLEAMTFLGVGWFTRTIMYIGVRIFGASSYTPRRQEKP
jgi:hypothetical protein